MKGWEIVWYEEACDTVSEKEPIASQFTLDGPTQLLQLWVCVLLSSPSRFIEPHHRLIFDARFPHGSPLDLVLLYHRAAFHRLGRPWSTWVCSHDEIIHAVFWVRRCFIDEGAERSTPRLVPPNPFEAIGISRRASAIFQREASEPGFVDVRFLFFKDFHGNSEANVLDR